MHPASAIDLLFPQPNPWWSFQSLNCPGLLSQSPRADSQSDRKMDERARAVSKGGVARGRAGWSRASQVHTDPEWVEVEPVMLSQLPAWVSGASLGPAGHGSFSGMA